MHKILQQPCIQENQQMVAMGWRGTHRALSFTAPAVFSPKPFAGDSGFPLAPVFSLWRPFPVCQLSDTLK